MLDGLMKQFEETQKQMQEKLSQETFDLESAEGKIRLTCDGTGNIRDLSIDEALMNAESKEMLEDLLLDTVNRAFTQAQGMQAEASKSNISNMLPGGFNLDSIFGS